jgi:hypothetical protein
MNRRASFVTAHERMHELAISAKLSVSVPKPDRLFELATKPFSHCR